MTISHYELVEEVGRGGMGVVYKARDSRLGRTVALKLLPAHLSNDAEAKARFLHEGRAASILDHPNICTIYDVGESEDGGLFMAMAFVEGTPLSDLIAERPLELVKALDIAIALGEGLEHSHSAGVIHRDMKPANVMVSGSGTVKILDFGLARLQGATMLTASGTTLGTAAYMSPEQAQGQRADHRTDIWALGTILYEMVAGSRPFAGEYQQALTYSIVNAEPEPLTSRRTGVPLELDRIVAKSLCKDPADRYQHVDELLVDLRKLRSSITSGVTISSGSVRSEPAGRGPRMSWSAILGLVLLSIAAGVGLTRLLFKPTGPASLQLRLTVETGPIPVPDHPLAPPLAVSPDGMTLAYAQQPGASSVLVLRRLNRFAETIIDGSEGGRSPFFSPDGLWLGFLTDSQLRKYSLQSRQILTVTSVPPLAHGASWGADGMIYVGLAHSLAKVPASGGDLEEFSELDANDHDTSFLVWPQVTAGGDYLLATTTNASGIGAKVWAVNTSNGQRTFLLEGGNSTFLSPDIVVVGRGQSLWAAKLDLDPPTVRSLPVRVFENVLGALTGEPSLTLYAASPSGVLAVVRGQASSGTHRIAAVDAQGSLRPLASESGTFFGLAISPDGRRIATTRVIDEGRQVVVYDREREIWTTLTSGADHFWPRWKPGEDRILSTTATGGTSYGLASQRLGSHDVEFYIQGEYAYQIQSWLHGSDLLVLQRSKFPDTEDFDIVTLSPGQEPVPLIATPFPEIHAAVSPNEKWIAYASTNRLSPLDPSFEVFVRSINSAEPTVQVSNDGGWAPRWTPDGTRLFYEADAGLMVADWPDPDKLRPGHPEPFYTGSFARSLRYGLNYDVGPDGNPVILASETEVRNLQVVTGWLDELESLLSNQ